MSPTRSATGELVVESPAKAKTIEHGPGLRPDLPVGFIGRFTLNRREG